MLLDAPAWRRRHVFFLSLPARPIPPTTPLLAYVPLTPCAPALGRQAHPPIHHLWCRPVSHLGRSNPKHFTMAVSLLTILHFPAFLCGTLALFFMFQVGTLLGFVRWWDFTSPLRNDVQGA